MKPSAYGKPSDSLSISDFHRDKGLCQGEIVLDIWDNLFGTQGPYTFFFELEIDETITEFSEVQKAGYNYAIENQEEIAAAILTALLREYPDMQEDYGYDEEEKAELMPDAADVNALAKLLSPNAVIIHPVELDGLPYIGYEFGCTWDEEHALGAMLHGTRVAKIGGADTAILTWIAQRDLDGLTHVTKGSDL